MGSLHSSDTAAYIKLLKNAVQANNEKNAREHLNKLLSAPTRLHNLVYKGTPFFNLVIRHGHQNIELIKDLFTTFLFKIHWVKHEPTLETLKENPNVIFLYKLAMVKTYGYQCYNINFQNTDNSIIEGSIPESIIKQSNLTVGSILSNHKNVFFLEPRMRDKNGKNALHTAVEFDQSDDACLVKFLLDHCTFDVNEAFEQDCTAIVMAVQNDRALAVKYLAEYGADFFQFIPQNSSRVSLLHYATTMNFPKVVQQLQLCGAGIEDSRVIDGVVDHIFLDYDALLSGTTDRVISQLINRCTEIIAGNPEAIDVYLLLKIRLTLLLQTTTPLSKLILAVLLTNVKKVGQLNSYLRAYHQIVYNIGEPLRDIEQSKKAYLLSSSLPTFHMQKSVQIQKTLKSFENLLIDHQNKANRLDNVSRRDMIKNALLPSTSFFTAFYVVAIFAILIATIVAIVVGASRGALTSDIRILVGVLYGVSLTLLLSNACKSIHSDVKNNRNISTMLEELQSELHEFQHNLSPALLEIIYKHLSVNLLSSESYQTLDSAKQNLPVLINEVKNAQATLRTKQSEYEEQLYSARVIENARECSVVETVDSDTNSPPSQWVEMTFLPPQEKVDRITITITIIITMTFH